ncbi:hypothetical protein ACWGB8_18015 [Kitasatospora sp. NPDC054939]
MSSSASEHLSAAEALRLAEQARAASGDPARLPAWYGPAFGAGFTLYGTGLGQVIGSDQPWMVGVVAAGFAALTGALAALASRQGGIVRRTAPGIGGPVVLAVLSVIGAALAGLLLALAAGGGARSMGAVAGIAAGAAFWIASGRLNAFVERRSGKR